MRRIFYSVYARPLRMMALGLGLVGGLAACAPAGDPVPRDAALTRDMLSVTMSDGQRCFGPRPAEATAQGWQGRLEGCSAAYAYEVRLDPRSNPLREIIGAIFAALTLDDQLAEVAEVGITGADGRRYVFASPPPIED
ncbi:hypothetical protein [Alkalilacustris brevis]|uniref:hypothetical protein n=1 Tax=Alkalilacustris brevis TaxID=2026338 RepID=UPI000E0CDF15|nr:hypothetical protein [Alkalilacustris brevis]